MDDFYSRLQYFIEDQKLSVRAFEIKIGVSDGVIGKMLRSKTSTNIENLQKILKTFDKLNANWLLIGVGDIYINELKPKEMQATIGGLQRLIDENRNEIIKLKDEKITYLTKIDNLHERIEILNLRLKDSEDQLRECEEKK